MHSVLLTTDKTVWTVGWNNKGQLGIASPAQYTLTWTKVTDLGTSE